MFEFAGDVSRKDVKNALMDVLESEYRLISSTEDNGMALRIQISRDFTPELSLEYTSDTDIRATFQAQPIVDDYDTIIGCKFTALISNASINETQPRVAENRFYRWYQFATVVKEITSVTFYPYDYFD